ncbi:hypothetical protein CMV_009258 [Castanea mollissima]|uniref:Uncharacterized protein n=1 Tax=Castanea mollissima TaxID=60419 RepID=A0A8J4RN56_9ROSI|nr:hypothetical protein CMV_009258 [Castanea mollissima]
MVFTAGCSGDGMPSSQVEMDIDGIMGETEKGVEEVMEAEITEVNAAKTQLGEVVASATLNISRACLKHIDPKLRRQRNRNVECPISSSNLTMDNMIEELEPQANPQEHHIVGMEGMQAVEGGESPGLE